MQNIQMFRKEQGLTQAKLAQMMSVSRSTIAMWESGKSSPDNFDIIKLAALFNISVDELLGVSTGKGSDTIPEDSTSYSISLDEQALLNLYRNLNSEGKKKAADYIDDLASNPKYNSDDRLFYIRTAASNGSAGMDEFYKAPKLAYSTSELEEIKKLKDIDDLE